MRTCFISVRFMTLKGDFKNAKEEKFNTLSEATDAVKRYAESQGYTNVKFVEDPEEPDCGRFTAKTPGGRNGRNIAFLDWLSRDEYDLGYDWESTD